ncbi:hypothetical protein BT63DRAFT_422425 [Microthyrium microscopicum]|uniref:Capsule polysaccharide biosynthesis protein n=1 Tax=Microthyrium microscopicum TaxID=703497 RepID=A0A6A6UI03_9PEZI|nr:hypothetical protein BT63DRAFT_422425 [Microthyrium microscopicum]
MPYISPVAAVAITALAASTNSTLRAKLITFLKSRILSWRSIAIVLALLNLKNLPFIWHIRLFKGIWYHVYGQPTDIPPNALFKFSITRSHTPLWEMDYNLHKSNSTYFTDADIARTHLVTALLRKGILDVGKVPGEEATTWNLSTAIRRKTKDKSIKALATSGVETATTGVSTPGGAKRTLTEEEFKAIVQKPGPLLMALGSVACFFHREIVPYRQYEIWTRLLTWDRKWMYIVSYFVEAGALQPKDFILQPWRSGKNVQKVKEGETLEEKRQRVRGKVLATSIATYVVKKGRLTLPPEIVLQRSHMLPPRPVGMPSAVFGLSTEKNSPSTPAGEFSDPGINGTTSSDNGLNAGSVNSILEESLFPEVDSDNTAQPWTWDIVEKERLRGLKFAQAFDGLNALREEFDAGEGSALGVFGDRFGIL